MFGKLKNKGLLYFGLILVFSLFSSYKSIDETEKQKVTLMMVLQSIVQYHYQSPSIDDEFSKKVYHTFLEELDPNKRFFTIQDLAEFKKYETSLDDEIATQKFDFFELVNARMELRVKLVSDFYHSLLDKPFDFTKEETIELDKNKRLYSGDEEEFKNQWRKYFKYQVLTSMVSKLDGQDKAKEKGDTSVKIKDVEILEKEAREKVLKSQNEVFKRISRITKQERFEVFVNAVVHVFDPHSDYFPPKEKENFDIQLSGKLEGIGATLQERDGYIKVVSIVPGSPSAKQGELKVEDLILKVGQGEDEPVDIVDMRLDQAVKLIRGKKGSLVKLTVKKPDGNLKIIPIIRDVVVIEESYAKSYIIKENKSKKKIGYINLPSFYVDFNNPNGRKCSDDIAKEINKLKNEQASAIILDLRNNGGGSLNDVVTMGGFFIDKGPIVQVKTRVGSPMVLDDRNPGVLFDGPLVILVNQFSASASEILAAAMQDYKRAIIIGSTSSFGKGTVQRIFELPQPVEDLILGSAKITTQKFYRINGGSTQLKGVVPDIILPDMYMKLKLGEKEMDYALEWDQIEKAKYDYWQNGSLNVEKIKVNSDVRTQKNEMFQQISANAEYIYQKQENSEHQLNLNNYRAELKALNKEEEKHLKSEKTIHHWHINSLKVDADENKDSVRSERNKTYIENLKKDAYLFEAVQVIKDME